MRRAQRAIEATGKPHVTVVVPCYNYGRYLAQAVASTTSQRGVHVDTIVVDDASTDDSFELARRMSLANASITVLRHDENWGHIRTYNDGLGIAAGEYVVLMSADDALAPGSLARATGLMERNPSVGMVYGYAPPFLDVTPPPRSHLPHVTVWSGLDWIAKVCRSGRNPVSTPAAVMRRTVFDQIKQYDSRLPHTADLLMWLQAARLSDVGYVNGTPQAFYRVHPQNMHSNQFGTPSADLTERTEAFRIFFDESMPDNEFSSRARAQYENSLRTEARLRDGAEEAAPSWSTTQRDRLKWRYWRRFGLYL